MELGELIPVYGDPLDGGIQICEVAGYPIKTLVFMSRDNPKLLARVMSEICSVLQDRDAVFSLLISDRARKFFLFPQVFKSINSLAFFFIKILLNPLQHVVLLVDMEFSNVV